MERHVKQRLIGATILLFLVVLLVPEFLSGPKPPAATPATLPVPTHTYTVDLNDPTRATLQEPVPTATATPPPPASAPTETPAPTSSPAPAPAPAATPAPMPAAASTPVPELVPKPIATAPNTAPTAASANGAWSVQLGSFASRANAEKLVHSLAAKGYTAALSSVGAGAAARYRVRIGQIHDREAAQRLIGRLKSQGVAATLVPPS